MTWKHPNTHARGQGRKSASALKKNVESSEQEQEGSQIENTSEDAERLARRMWEEHDLGYCNPDHEEQTQRLANVGAEAGNTDGKEGEGTRQENKSNFSSDTE